MKSVEEFFQGGRAIFKNSVEIRCDKKSIDEGATHDGILDFVANERTAVLFLKAMFMMPAAVGSVELVIGEEVRRVPSGDFTLPAYRYAVEL